jgi:hypothetical protein
MIQLGELSSVGAQRASPSQSFQRWVVGADVRVQLRLPRVGTLMVYGEVVGGSNLDRGLHAADPITAGRDLSELGYYVAVTQELTRWAVVGLRFDEYLADRAAPDAPEAAPRYSTLSAVAQARYSSFGRLFFEYDYDRTTLRDPGTGAASVRVSHQLGMRAELVF